MRPGFRPREKRSKNTAREFRDGEKEFYDQNSKLVGGYCSRDSVIPSLSPIAAWGLVLHEKRNARDAKTPKRMRQTALLLVGRVISVTQQDALILIREFTNFDLRVRECKTDMDAGNFHREIKTP